MTSDGLSESNVGGALMEYFGVSNLPKNESGQTLPKSLGDFLGNPNRIAPFVAHAAAERLVARGYMVNVGQTAGPPMLGTRYVAVGTSGAGLDIFDFVVGGFPEIRRRRWDAVLHLDVTKPDGASDSGTGFLVADGLLVTARHCIEGMRFKICDPRSDGDYIETAGEPSLSTADLAIVPLKSGHGIGPFRIGQPRHATGAVSHQPPRMRRIHRCLGFGCAKGALECLLRWYRRFQSRAYN